MAILTTYGSFNRVVDQDKVVNYSVTKTYNRYTVDSLLGSSLDYEYEYVRTCTKSYRYVGMDRDAAGRCAAEMIDKYTRSTKISEWNVSATTATFVDVNAGSRLMAQIAIVHTAGCMYDVQISINETDVRIRELGTITPSSLFVAENARDYDEEDY